MLRTLQRFMLVTALAGLCTYHAACQNKKPVQDILSVPGPLQFNSSSYFLSWSAHPSADYLNRNTL